jgi:hypothetical protein
MSEPFDRARRRLVDIDGATEGPATPAVADLGAMAGCSVGFPGDVNVSLYEFASWSEANQAARAWNERDGEDGLVWRAATNGPILLVGKAPDNEDDDYAARFALNGLISTFAGKE